jgi:aspartate racemase
MSTTGTRRSRVWHELLESAGYDIVEVEESVQPELHETIYHPEWGLKAVSPASETACGRFANYADALISDGADVLVLGCTEIPLALPGLRFRNTPLVDPVLALARGMIREGDADKLRPLHQSGSDQPS